MSKFKKYSSIYNIYRILFIICPFLFAFPTISCSNSNNSSINIDNNGKKFRVIKNQSLISTQVANYIGDFKIATITINEGEASLLLGSSNQNEVPKKYKKNDQIRLATYKNGQMALLNENAQSIYDIYGEHLYNSLSYNQNNSIICESNYVTYSVTIDGNIPWPKNGATFSVDPTTPIINLFEPDGYISKFIQWDWTKTGTPTRPEARINIIIEVLSGVLRYKTKYDSRWRECNPGGTIPISIRTYGYDYPFSYSLDIEFNTANTATIKVTISQE